jgi:uncharacterized glyoxalase superfamily protein PhnB
MKGKISMITLGVRDITRALNFYRSLKFQTHNYKDDDQMVMFKLEGTWLGLYPRELLAEDADVSNEGHGFAAFTMAHNVKSEEEVDEVFGLAVTAGAKPIKTPQKVFWGGYSGYFSDPDGFLWEVAFNPFTDLS